MPTPRPPAGSASSLNYGAAPCGCPDFSPVQVVANFISLIASESLTQPPIRRVA